MKGFTKINGIEVANEIFTTKFSCDYNICKGACCWGEVNGEELMGGMLTSTEAREIFLKKRTIAQYCSRSMHKHALTPTVKYGDNYYTSLHGSSCVFCNMTKKSCALKLAKDAGKLSFGIPQSCHLYPLDYENNRLELSHLFDEYCKCAYEKGEKLNIYLLQFSKDVICRVFGKTFYDLLLQEQQKHI